MKSAGQGHLEAGTQRSLLFFSFLFIFPFNGHGLFFLFFLFFLSFFPTYLLSHSFIIISIAALGGFNLYTHSLFSSSLYNLAYFFPLALLHIILNRSCFCLFLLAIFASFCFFPGIISITKTKNWRARAIWCFLNLFYFVSFTL